MTTTRAPAPARSRISRDGRALVLSSGATAVLTLGFWAVAARTTDPAAMGRASAQISAITLVASIAQLNLVNIFLRFLPAAGHRTRRVLALGYAAMMAAAVVGGWLYLALGLDAGLDLGPGTWPRVLFVAAVAAQAVFVVQDGVLTAFGRAPWVPLENLATVGVRLAVLVLPLGLTADLGLAGTWFVPLGVAALLVTGLVFTRLTAHLHDPAAHPSTLPPTSEIARFVAAEHVNNVVGNTISFVPPLLVLHLLGPVAAAFFTVPWLMITTMQLLLWNVVQPFIVESARKPGAAPAAARQTLRIGAGLAAAATLALLLGAPLLLGLQGREFADAGTPLLRALALSVPCTAVVVLYSAIAIVRRRLWLLVGLNTLAAIAVLGGLVLVLPAAGVAGAGVLYLAVQAALALAVLGPVVSWFRGRRPGPLPEGAIRDH
jgi:O-antigen/teichoic acid export membrane protein